MIDSYRRSRDRIAKIRSGVKTAEISYKHVNGGNVPGGHNVIYEGKKQPFITPMKECNSIELHHSDIIVDIGAYCGTYAIRCARFPVKKVIAYEPTPRTFAILSLTDLPNLTTVQAAVVGDDSDFTELYISRGIGVTNSTTLFNRKVEAVRVPAVRYEDAVAEATVVKIDVEGGEYALDIIQPQLRALIIDFHPIPGDWISKANVIVENIKQAGFETVIEPNWENGWTRAGSWVRPMQMTGEFTPMMSGELCCGCGAMIMATTRSLCSTCFNQWSKKHRANYELAKTIR